MRDPSHASTSGFSTPRSVTIADEPLGDGAALTTSDGLLSIDGFEIVPARTP